MNRCASLVSLLPYVKPRYAGYTCWRGVVLLEQDDLQYLNVFLETWDRRGRFNLYEVKLDGLL